MWMWALGLGRVAEDVLEADQPGAHAIGGRLEHMFDRLGRPPDGTGEARCLPKKAL